MDNAGLVMAKYIRGINLIAAEDGAGVRKYYLYNGHGDVIQLTDTSGNVIKNYDYDAFGNEKNPDPNDTNVFRYCGEYFDKEIGTIYLRARYYQPTTGRFTSEDPIQSGLNWYTYAANNPIMFVDPFGLEAVVISGGYAGYEKFKYQFIETGLRAIIDLQKTIRMRLLHG